MMTALATLAIVKMIKIIGNVTLNNHESNKKIHELLRKWDKINKINKKGKHNSKNDGSEKNNNNDHKINQ